MGHSPGVVATALIGSFEPVGGTVAVAPDERIVVTAIGVANSELPMFVDVPNTCSFPSFSSFVAHFGGVFAGSSMEALSSYAPCRSLSNPRGPNYKKRVCADSIASLNHRLVSDTSVPPTNATTTHYRSRYPHPYQGRRRYMSPAIQSIQVVGQTRWVEAEAEKR